MRNSLCELVLTRAATETLLTPRTSVMKILGRFITFSFPGSPAENINFIQRMSKIMFKKSRDENLAVRVKVSWYFK
jgi:hypothetical protein